MKAEKIILSICLSIVMMIFTIEFLSLVCVNYRTQRDQAIKGDLNLDGRVDFDDVHIMSQNWSD